MAGTTLSTILADIKAYRRVYLLAITASFGGLIMKQDTGLIGGVLTMKAFQKSFHLNSKSKDFANLQGNIVSVLQAGCFFGAGSSFFISSWFGRKKALLVAVFFFLLGSTMQTCSGIGTTSLGLLYAGRVVGGYGVGIISAAVPTTGIMLSYFVNYGVNLHITDGSPKTWRIPFAIQMLPGVILGTGLLFQKESPRWRVEKGRVEEARHVLARVRARPIDDERITLELDEIIQDFHGKEHLTFFQQGQAIFASKQISYPVSMALALQFFQQWSGTNSINYYSPQIFKSIGLSSTSAGLFATGIYGVVKTVMTGLSLALAIEQVGRKWCLIIGGLGQAFGMLYIGAHSAVHPTVQGAPLDGGSTFAIVCIYLYVAFYSLAWGHIPYILSSECSPNHVRSLVTAAALMLQWLCNFAIAKLTPIMLANITWGTFLVFGMSCILMATFAAIFVPETKNVPLETVHLLFEGKTSTIVRHAFKDIRPKHQRARELRERHLVSHAVEDRASSGDDEDLEKNRGKRQVEELLK